jgi:hypothetical protein
VAVQRLVIDNWWPTLVNVLLRADKYTRCRLLHEDAELIAAEALNQRLTRTTRRKGDSVRRRVSLLIRYRKGETAPDPDACWKSLLDGLVYARLLVNDDRHWLEIGGVSYEEAPRRGVVVTLEDLPS